MGLDSDQRTGSDTGTLEGKMRISLKEHGDMNRVHRVCGSKKRETSEKTTPNWGVKIVLPELMGAK